MTTAAARVSGRPLRFLALVLGGWVTARLLLLWPAVQQPATARHVPTDTIADSGLPVDADRWLVTPSYRHALLPWPQQPTAPLRRAVVGDARPRDAPARAIRSTAPLTAVANAATPPEATTPGTIPPPLRPAAIARGRSRLAGSAWAIVRGGGAVVDASALGGQLGGSQAGARLTYALGTGRRVALSLRFATPLAGRGREAGIGIDWQPTRLPFHLIAEQRVSLDGGRGGPALLLVGGLPPLPVAAGFVLEGYGQAGAIGRDGVEAFGDGAARLTHRLATLGPVRLDLGGGSWGAAQRGVRRLDLGPTVGAVVPVADAAVRVTLDWRQRVAGNARPGSGPALSVGTDF